MNTAAVKRAKATLKLPKRIGNYILHAKAILRAITGNAFFSEPNPTLERVAAHLISLDTAQSFALSRVKGSIEARDVQKALVDKDLYALQAYVQGIADNDPGNAEAIIESAGLNVRKAKSRTKGDFEVRHGKVSGSVILVARAVSKRASYNWQMNTDNVNWKDLPGTLTSHAEVNGLTPGVTCYFRFRSLTKSGESSWSQVVSLVII